MALDFDDLDVAESALKYNSITEAELETSQRHGAAELTVKVIGGLSGDELCCVSVSRTTSVRVLKACIANHAEISASEQRLIAGGMQLCDHEILGETLVSGTEDSAEVAVIRASAARAKVLDDVRNDKSQLQELEEEHRGDPEIVLAALLNDKFALKHAAPAAQQHLTVVLQAVRCHGGNLQYVAQSLRVNREVVLAAVQQCGEALLHVPEALRSDRQVVLAAVKQDGRVLRHAPKDTRGDFDVVRAAVEQNGEALRYASKEAQRNLKLILAAVSSSNGEALLHTDRDIRANQDIVEAAVQLQGLALAFASDELQRDRRVVLLAVQSNGGALKYAAEEMRSDIELVLQAVSNHGMALQWASEELRKNEAVALAAIQQNKHAIRFVGTNLMTNLSFLVVAGKSGIPRDDALDHYLAASPEAANELRIQGRSLFFDVRSFEEFLLSHVSGAYSLHVNQRQRGQSMVSVANEHPENIIFIYNDDCRVGGRDSVLARELRRHLPNQHVLRLAGGLDEWKNKGFPVEGDPSFKLLNSRRKFIEAMHQERRKFLKEHEILNPNTGN